MNKAIKSGWYVLYVRSSQEKKVHRDLTEKSIESFLPLIKTVKQWSDRKKTIFTPLFPSYVFVNVQSQFDFHNVLSLSGACAFLKFGSEYGMVSQKEIDQIKLLVERDEITEVSTNVKLPRIGDKLKIQCGELTGLECEVYRVDNVHKVSIWLNSLRQNVSATVPAYYLQQPAQNRAYV